MNIAKKMSLWGIGPVYSLISILLAGIAIYIHYLAFPYFFCPDIPLIIVLLLAIPLIVIGLLLWIIAGMQIDNYINKGILADKGVYSIVRNPIYSGILYVITGVLLLFRSIILWPVPIVIYLILKILLLKEEKILTKYFGEVYLNYRKKVNSIIPNPKILIFLFHFLKEKRRATKKSV